MKQSGSTTLILGLVAATLAAATLSLFIGYAPLSPRKVVAGLFTGGDTSAIIIREIRVPRMLLGLVSGAALGMSGAVLQGLLRNPLAEPGVTGVSAFAALGAVIAMYFGLSSVWPLALPALAIAGALLSAGLLFAVSARDSGILTLILAGVALSSLAGALTALALNLAPNPYAVSEIVFWLLGSLRDRSVRRHGHSNGRRERSLMGRRHRHRVSRRLLTRCTLYRHRRWPRGLGGWRCSLRGNGDRRR